MVLPLNLWSRRVDEHSSTQVAVATEQLQADVHEVLKSMALNRASVSIRNSNICCYVSMQSRWYQRGIWIYYIHTIVTNQRIITSKIREWLEILQWFQWFQRIHKLLIITRKFVRLTVSRADRKYTIHLVHNPESKL